MHGIDLAYLRRRGLLAPGRRSSMTWSLGGERTGSITIIIAQPDGVRLMYQVTDRDGARVSVDELVPFTYTVHASQVRRPAVMAPLP
jgi:hypothetical protein